MRVLFAVNPSKTIFMYMVPLAWAMRTAGHEVRFASQPQFAGVITQAGLTAVPVGHDRDLTPDKEHRAGIPVPYDAFDDPSKQNWEYLKPGMAATDKWWHRYGNFPIIADLVEFAQRWQPDLVIWDPLTLAAPIAAKACGAAHARLLFGVDVYGGVRQLYTRLRDEQPEGERSDPVADWMAAYGRKYGYEYSDDMLTGHFTIDQFPASLAVDAPGLEYVRMQFISYGGPAVVPRWLWAPPERPRIALTMGLSATEVYDGYTISVSEVLQALSGLDIEVVATVADSERQGLGAVPDNVRLIPFVPWHAFVPTCSVVIHHGGAATLAATARHPVPHLTLHYHYDQPIYGRLLSRMGAGLDMATGQATGDAVRTAVLRLLHEPTFKAGAARLRDETLALPSPNQLVPQLEQLTTKYRTDGRAR
ncbi:activator-dependent family glycosyltransferase [Micromonospora sp. NPDC047793]|uniref:activator-dependent family glycosyltransferase n=1 Tax=unclassified Micromonospora TaxID=2617518 RepID=UPI001034467D|nr:activator-dependent family glycosyltransferase [Verrucosispora sp. SN26_14.1]TBL45474.1 activator-dependent family glycosyltransferase [Verrucosispora sp. SN26_14.1]